LWLSKDLCELNKDNDEFRNAELGLGLAPLALQEGNFAPDRAGDEGTEYQGGQGCARVRRFLSGLIR